MDSRARQGLVSECSKATAPSGRKARRKAQRAQKDAVGRARGRRRTPNGVGGRARLTLFIQLDVSDVPSEVVVIKMHTPVPNS